MIGGAFAWLGLILCAATPSWSFESTKVLPKGVRSLNLRSVSTQLGRKTTASEQQVSLAAPLEQPMLFRHVIEAESGARQAQLRGFLLEYGFSPDQSLGRYTADMSGRVQVNALVASYGLSNRVTLALAVPYYRAETDIAVGFVPSSAAQKFVNLLGDPAVAQNRKAREAAMRLNQAPLELNAKLAAGGYRELGKWQAEGVGDTTIAAKVLAPSWNESLSMGWMLGAVLPTGRGEDPNILTDVSFGDEQWDVFGQAIADQRLPHGWTANEYVKYTYQFAGPKRVRMKTESEPLMVPEQTLRRKLGDKLESGLSLTGESDSGWLCGAGAVFEKKYADRYQTANTAAKSELEKDSDSYGLYAEAKVGISTVKAYFRKTFPAPTITSLSYRKHMRSRNLPITNLALWEVNLFF